MWLRNYVKEQYEEHCKDINIVEENEVKLEKEKEKERKEGKEIKDGKEIQKKNKKEEKIEIKEIEIVKELEKNEKIKKNINENNETNLNEKEEKNEVCFQNPFISVVVAVRCMSTHISIPDYDNVTFALAVDWFLRGGTRENMTDTTVATADADVGRDSGVSSISRSNTNITPPLTRSNTGISGNAATTGNNTSGNTATTTVINATNSSYSSHSGTKHHSISNECKQLLLVALAVEGEAMVAAGIKKGKEKVAAKGVRLVEL